MGDPQVPFRQLQQVLEHHQLLNQAGNIADDVHLISVGDHFDYGMESTREAAAEGLAILRWLTAQPRSRCTVLLGNHDTVRVMELMQLASNSDFERAQVTARALYHKKKEVAGALSSDDEVAFRRNFPTIPTIGYAARDYSAFAVEQRELLMQVLLQERVALAAAVTLTDGRAALVTHAGVTTRETAMLALDTTATPHMIAAALNAFLRERVGRVRAAWMRDERVPLDLAPLVVTSPDQESGGMLFHRPCNPDREGADRAWELFQAAPRRFDPRTLPTGLVQVVGHTGHRKCLQMLGSWVTTEAAAHKVGGIRTLLVVADVVRYHLGCLPPLTTAASGADLIMIDGEMRAVPPSEYQLLQVEA